MAQMLQRKLMMIESLMMLLMLTMKLLHDNTGGSTAEWKTDGNNSSSSLLPALFLGLGTSLSSVGGTEILALSTQLCFTGLHVFLVLCK